MGKPNDLCCDDSTSPESSSAVNPNNKGISWISTPSADLPRVDTVTEDSVVEKPNNSSTSPELLSAVDFVKPVVEGDCRCSDQGVKIDEGFAWLYGSWGGGTEVFSVLTTYVQQVYIIPSATPEG